MGCLHAGGAPEGMYMQFYVFIVSIAIFPVFLGFVCVAFSRVHIGPLRNCTIFVKSSICLVEAIWLTPVELLTAKGGSLWGQGITNLYYFWMGVSVSWTCSKTMKESKTTEKQKAQISTTLLCHEQCVRTMNSMDSLIHRCINELYKHRGTQ